MARCQAATPRARTVPSSEPAAVPLPPQLTTARPGRPPPVEELAAAIDVADRVIGDVRDQQCAALESLYQVRVRGGNDAAGDQQYPCKREGDTRPRGMPLCGRHAWARRERPVKRGCIQGGPEAGA